eukprot:scaffold22571_cov66-Skeletonema_marinoi.AAC.1
MSDKKPPPKKKPDKQRPPRSYRVGVDADDADELAADISRMTMNGATPSFSFHVTHPWLLKNIPVLQSTRRGVTILELFVYPCDHTYYDVRVENEGRTIEVRTRIADPFLLADRINDEVNDARNFGSAEDYELKQSSLTAHNKIVGEISKSHPNGLIWSHPPQKIRLPEKVENIVASKEIVWEPGCFELIEDFDALPTPQDPPMYAILRFLLQILPQAGISSPLGLNGHPAPPRH